MAHGFQSWLLRAAKYATHMRSQHLAVSLALGLLAEVRVLTIPFFLSWIRQGNNEERCKSTGVCIHHECGKDCNEDCLNWICDECSTPALVHEYGKTVGDPSDLVLHAKMYAIGEKYGVRGLKIITLRKFNIACKLYWNDQEFASAARYVYSSTVEEDRGLRDIVYNTVRRHLKLVKKECVAAFMDEFGLAIAMLADLADEFGPFRFGKRKHENVG